MVELADSELCEADSSNKQHIEYAHSDSMQNKPKHNLTCNLSQYSTTYYNVSFVIHLNYKVARSLSIRLYGNWY